MIMDRARNRIFISVVILTAIFFVIAARISWLAMRGWNSDVTDRNNVIRGPIKDRRGLTLAVTDEASTIALAPPEIVDPEFTAENLARLLDIEAREILNKIYVNQDRKYFLLKRQVDNFTADRIMEMNLPGVYRESEYRRVYPGESLASNLLGFVGRDQSSALGGLEYVFTEALTSEEKGEYRKGPTLKLTVDSLLQYRLEKIVGEAFVSSGSKRAVGILMDIKTGEVLAMANFPNFNPNEYYKSTPFQRGNWAIRLNYEPGSTVKIFMASILLAEKAMSLNEKILCDGEFNIGNVIIRDKHGDRVVNYGWLTLSEILRHSSNVGIIKAMQRIRKDRLHYYMRELGFGKKTGILPPGSGETAGYLPELKSWVPSTGYYMPIGQGFSVTPIQLLRAASSIANGGKLVTPYIADSIFSSRGITLHRQVAQSIPGPFNGKINTRVLKMMRGVVESGTGWRANVKNISIAGKTGTGQKSSAVGYSDHIIASFIGFFPEDNPRYGGLIVFDEPGKDQSGGSIAAPAFGEFVESILPLIKEGYNEEIAPELPALPIRRRAVNSKILYDFGGLSARESLKIIADYYGIPVRLKGTGYVYRQIPEAGTPISKVKELELYLDDQN